MSRAQVVLNLVTVLLLVSLGVGMLLMPRYNYAVIASRVAALGGRAAALESGVEKLNILAGPGEEKRAALLANLDLIARKTMKVDEDLVTFLEHSALTSSRLEDALQRLGMVEELVVLRPPPAGSPTSDEGATAVVPQVVPQAEVGEIARSLGLTPRSLAELDFDQFLALAAQRGLPGSRTAPGEKPASEGLHAGVKPLFESFRNCIQGINRSENLFVQELVEKATRTGDSVEEDDAEPGERRKPLQAPPESGTVYVKNREGGKRRVFHLSAEEHPEFARFEKLRDRALQSFLVSMSSLAQR